MPRLTSESARSSQGKSLLMLDVFLNDILRRRHGRRMRRLFTIVRDCSMKMVDGVSGHSFHIKVPSFSGLWSFKTLLSGNVAASITHQQTRPWGAQRLIANLTFSLPPPTLPPLTANMTGQTFLLLGNTNEIPMGMPR